MASTEKVSLSLDAGALLLARRAASLEDLSLSAYLSTLVRRHSWASQPPGWTRSGRQRRISAPSSSPSTRWPTGAAKASSVRRGELWHAPSPPRDRVILLLSSQGLIDQGATMLYGVEADPKDPGPLLLVVPIEVHGRQRWLNVQRGLTRVYRGGLAESYGPVDPVLLDQVDALVRVALDL